GSQVNGVWSNNPHTRRSLVPHGVFLWINSSPHPKAVAIEHHKRIAEGCKSLHRPVPCCGIDNRRGLEVVGLPGFRVVHSCWVLRVPGCKNSVTVRVPHEMSTFSHSPQVVAKPHRTALCQLLVRGSFGVRNSSKRLVLECCHKVQVGSICLRAIQDNGFCL